MRQLLILVQVLTIVLGQNNASINEYVKAIQDLQANFSQYEFPTDSRSYLQGSTENQSKYFMATTFFYAHYNL